jgi:hypothetical protein
MKSASKTLAALSLLTPGRNGPSPGHLLAGWMQANCVANLGIANTMRAASAYDRVKYRPQHSLRFSLYRNQFDTLLEENGAPLRPLL